MRLAPSILAGKLNKAKRTESARAAIKVNGGGELTTRLNRQSARMSFDNVPAALLCPSSSLSLLVRSFIRFFVSESRQKGAICVRLCVRVCVRSFVELTRGVHEQFYAACFIVPSFPFILR